jgi:hypothetical protein
MRNAFNKSIEWFKQRSFSFWILVVLVISAVILWIAGFSIIYAPDRHYDWSAINAIGQWVAAFAGFLVPVVAVIIAHNLQASERSIGNSNALMLGEMKENMNAYNEKIALLERMIEENKIEFASEEEVQKMLDSVFKDVSKSPDKTEDEIHNELKEKALKFLNISMHVHTSQVATYLGIEIGHAWDILNELLMHDKKIVCYGQRDKNNPDKNLWSKKK